MHRFLLLLITSCLLLTVNAQTWVSQIQYLKQEQYLRLTCANGTCEVLLPNLAGSEKLVVKGDPQTIGSWTFVRDFETWQFETVNPSAANGTWAVEMILPFRQTVHFFQQGAPIDRQELYRYSGTFGNPQGELIITYPHRGFLRMESSLSGQNHSLKPLQAEQTFWAASGERLRFTEMVQGVYQQLEVLNDDGTVRSSLQRQVEVRRIDVSIPTTTDTLVGKLFLPDVPLQQKLPACVLLPAAAGQVSMENNVYEAQWLAAHGMVCLIFDKPGMGLSTAHMNFETATFEEKAKLFHQVVEYLMMHEQVDMEKLGVHGGSQSGRLAIMMAMDRPARIAFANAVSAPLMNQMEQQLFAVNHFHRQKHVNERTNVRILQLWQRYLQGIIDGAIPQDLPKEITSLHQLDSTLFLPPNSTTIPASPNAEDLQNDRILQEIKKLRRPIFLQYGEFDERVDAQNSVYQLEQQAYIKRMVQVRFYSRANHSLMTPEGEIAPAYLVDKVNWLRSIGVLR